MSTILECQDVTVHYGAVAAVDGLHLTVSRGETVALLGPSGSGKSTAMYAIAGFTPVSKGRISLAGREMSSPRHTTPPEGRPVGLVFQNYALWPHMSAVQNVAYPLRRGGRSKADSLVEAAELLEKVGIGELAGRKPAELSGGQQQRVGLARALARSADLYLFDEPTAHLDSPVRGAVEEEIRRRRSELGAAAVYSTHDSSEALAVADRVAVLREGAIIQTGSPAEIYERPIDEWAARLTGPVATLRGEVVGSGAGTVEVALGDTTTVAGANSPSVAGSVLLLVRPEWVTPGGPIRGIVDQVSFRGPHTDYVIETAFGTLVSRIEGSPRLAQGERTGWSIERGWVPES